MLLLLAGAIVGFGSYAIQPGLADAYSHETRWKSPLLGEGRVSSRFGLRESAGVASVHRGMDFAAGHGTPVHAVAAGGVELADAEADSGYGIQVVIDHGNGLQTRYANLQVSYVRPGQTVTEGARIALVGTSGRSTGPHLHFEVLRDGEPVDPQAYLKASTN